MSKRMASDITMSSDIQTKNMGTLFNLVHWIRKFARLHRALVNLSHDGSSRRSVSTNSSNSKFAKSPSPLNVLRFIWSSLRFFVNLKKKGGNEKTMDLWNISVTEMLL